MKSNDVQSLWERRDRLHIMAEIMEVAKGSQLKTRIMYKVNLSFSQVNEYISFLTEMGFLRVRVENGKKLYETTAKGKLYIENYIEMSNLLRSQDHAEAQILLRGVLVEIPNQQDYNIFTALLETIHKKDRGRLRFAKCQKCGRLTPFRLISVTSFTVKCKKCGNSVPIGTEN